MNKVIYPQKRKFSRYDDHHYLLYLNEEVVEDYIPDDAQEDFTPITAYSYTGDQEDGSTMIHAIEATYEAFVSGLIRTRYSADQVEAILLNIQSNNPERQTEFQDELDQLNAFREECKAKAASLLE